MAISNMLALRFFNFALAVLAICAAVGCSQDPPPTARRFGSSGPNAPVRDVKNVVIISVDTCRADRLSCYGFSKATTPNIDAVARDGVLFLRAQTTNSLTLPAHSSMMTGTLPPVHGVRNNYNYRLGESQVTLAETFQDNGYQTAAVVSAFTLASQFGLNQGFDVYNDFFLRKHDPRAPRFLERPADEVTQAAITWLEKNHEEPFFLFVHYFDPHQPLQPPKEFAKRFPGDPYAAEIAYTDDQIGLLLEKLTSLGLYDSATIVITSDHGEGLGEHGEETHGYFVYQSTNHVPLVIKPSTGGLSGVSRGAKIEQPVSVIDIPPTVLAAVGLETPGHMQGLDLGPCFAGEQPPENDRPVYCESLKPTMFGCSPLRSIVHDRWQYVWSVNSELYDLDKDPKQKNNVIDEYPEIVTALHIQLTGAMEHQGGSQQRGTTQSLDESDRARLQSLGYVGGAVSDAVELDSSMCDPKEFIWFYTRLQEVEGHIVIGHLEEAKKLCELLLKSEPGLFRAHQLLANVAERQGRPDDAIKHYTDAVTLAAGNDRNTGERDTRSRFDVADAYVALGEMLFRKGDYSAAQEKLERALQDFPDYPRLLTQYGAVLVEIAAKTDAAGEKKPLLDRAVMLLKRTIEVEPKNADAHAYLGSAYLADNKGDLAKKHTSEALLLNPNHPTARVNLQRLRFFSEPATAPDN